MDVYMKDGDEYKPLSEDYTVLNKSDLNSQYVTKAEQDDAIEAAVKSRFRSHVHRDKVFDDEVLVAQFKERFSGESSGVDLDAQRKQWETANLRPVQEELESTQHQMQAITDRLRYAEMRDKLGNVFSDTFVSRIDPQKPSMAEVMLGDQVEYDVETSNVRLKGSSMSLEDFAKELSADEKYKAFLREPERNTSAAKVGQDKVSGSSGRVTRRSQLDEVSRQEYISKYGATSRKDPNTPSLIELKP